MTAPLPVLHRARVLSHREGVVHGFSDRLGGVSLGELASLNLAVRGGDPPARVAENWRRLLAALHPALSVDDLALLDQVHGRAVARVSRGGGPGATVAVADAAVSTVPGVVLGVRTADCVPILMHAPGAVAVAHAGWRGAALGVVEATVEDLCRAAGCAPHQVATAIGPHISVDAYEVGPEVIDGLCSRGLQRADVARPGPRGRDHADLEAAVRGVLATAGVVEIERVGGCTASDPSLYSHRRDGAGTGRLAGVIALVEAG